MTKSNGALSVVLLILVRLPSHPNIVFNRNQHWNIEPLSIVLCTVNDIELYTVNTTTDKRVDRQLIVFTFLVF